MVATIKKKRVSKRNKIAWRKHVDITDVEEFLEEQRLEERLGPPLETVPDDKLFQLDTTATTAVAPLSKRERAKLRLQNPKCFTILKPHTNVPDPVAQRNRVRTPEERKNKLLKKKEEELRKKGIFKAKELQSLRDRKQYELRKKSEPSKRGHFDANIWEEEKKEDIELDDWANNDTKKHNLVGTGKIRKVVRKPPSKSSSILPSVEPPHPGTSYNPSFKDHQELLSCVAEKEMKLMKKEAHLNRVTKSMFSKVTENQRDGSWLEEMCQGLPSTESTPKDEEPDTEYKAINPPVVNKKKTAKQRRKQKEQLQLQLKLQQKKLEKKKVTDIHKIKVVKSQIQKKDKKLAILKEKKKKAEQYKLKEPKMLSSVKFQEPDLEFNMGEDLSGNLRNLKKEGNLLFDRFKSLQKRNILEPTVRHVTKKAKVKVYTKPDHKEDWKKRIARA